MTDRKKIKKKSLPFEKILAETIIETAPTMIYLTDKEGNCTYANHRWCEAAGLTLEEAMGKGWMNGLHAEDRATIGEKWYRSVESGGAWGFEYRFQNREGRVTWVYGTAAPIRDADGSVIGYVGTNVDITDRKKTEEALQKSEARFRILFEKAADVILLLEIDPGAVPVIRDVNHKACQILGYEREELIGQPISFIETAADVSFLVKERREKIIANNGALFEAKHRCKDGSIREFECSVMETQLGPKLFAVSVERDITEQRKLEQNYRLLFQEMFSGFALHEIICDAAGHPVDYRFLAVNPAFERMTGLKAERIVGKTVLEVLPGTERHWIETYGKVALTGEPIHFENNARDLGKHFEVTAYRPANNQFACIFTDITDRKKVDDLLREKEFELSEAQRISHVGNWTYDPTTQQPWWSEEMFRIWGLDSKKGPPCYEEHRKYIHPDDFDRFDTAVKAAVEKGEPYHLELRLCRPDGSQRTIISICVPQRNEKGNVVALRGTIQDITDRKKTEEALRESEARYRLIAENTADAITVLDLSLKNTYVSPSTTKLKGFSVEETMAQTIEQTMTPGSLQIVYQAFEEEMALEQSGTADPTRSRILTLEEYCKDGSTIWVENTLSFIRDKEQRPTGILSISRDVTERKLMEEALWESERSLRATIDGLSAHIAVLDENGTIMLTNKAWRDFAEENGVPAGKVSEGINYLHICDSAGGDHAQEAAPFAQGIRDVLGGKIENFSMEYPCNSPDKIRWFIGRITVFPGVGPRRAVIAHENYTKRKLLELEREELIKALRDKNDEMESMLYASSHDLRTPLVSIQGFNGLIQNSIKELSALLDKDRPIEDICAEARPIITEKLPTASAYIGKSAEKMNGLVDGILRLSRLGRATHAPEKIDMNALVGQVLAALDFQIRQAQATVRVSDLPACWGDPHELEQAFTNLVDNALKYRDPARPLTIAITGTVFHNRVSYSIEDNGIGMKPEHYGQIWGLFSRLDPNGPVAGEGLGLAMVKRIIQRNHGKVWVESEKGRGSSFYLSLPRDRKEIGHDTEKR